jgi:hypothetical protein
MYFIARCERKAFRNLNAGAPMGKVPLENHCLFRRYDRCDQLSVFFTPISVAICKIFNTARRKIENSGSFLPNS